MLLTLAADFKHFSAYEEDFLKQALPYFDLIKVGPILGGLIDLSRIDNLLPHSPLFLDYKFHDIPNTVELALRNYDSKLSDLRYATVHGCGQDEMIQAALIALGAERILSVIQLTSKTIDLHSFLSQVERNYNLGVRGFISPVHCVPKIHQHLKDDQVFCFTPGIRSQGPEGDQQSTGSLEEAYTLGSQSAIIGRPILNASAPLQALQGFYDERNRLISTSSVTE